MSPNRYQSHDITPFTLLVWILETSFSFYEPSAVLKWRAIRIESTGSLLLLFVTFIKSALDCCDYIRTCLVCVCVFIRIRRRERATVQVSWSTIVTEPPRSIYLCIYIVLFFFIFVFFFFFLAARARWLFLFFTSLTCKWKSTADNESKWLSLVLQRLGEETEKKKIIIKPLRKEKGARKMNRERKHTQQLKRLKEGK